MYVLHTENDVYEEPIHIMLRLHEFCDVYQLALLFVRGVYQFHIHTHTKYK